MKCSQCFHYHNNVCINSKNESGELILEKCPYFLSDEYLDENNDY
jgi:hypothetical protein